MIVEDGCPEHLAESLRAYLEHGRPLGSFLEAVVSNDLIDAVARADSVNMRLLPEIVAFVYTHFPARGVCHGSREIYATWVARHARALEAARAAKQEESR